MVSAFAFEALIALASILSVILAVQVVRVRVLISEIEAERMVSSKMRHLLVKYALHSPRETFEKVWGEV